VTGNEFLDEKAANGGVNRVILTMRAAVGREIWSSPVLPATVAFRYQCMKWVEFWHSLQVISSCAPPRCPELGTVIKIIMIVWLSSHEVEPATLQFAIRWRTRRQRVFGTRAVCSPAHTSKIVLTSKPSTETCLCLNGR